MLLVTVSAMMGAGGEKVAREAAEILGFDFWGAKELLETAGELGIFSEFVVHELEGKSPSWWREIFDDEALIALERVRYLIYRAAAKGSAVFFEVGGQILFTPSLNAFHVLLTAPKEKRVQQVMVEGHVNKSQAEKKIARSDRQKSKFFQFAYREHWLNPYLYDLVLEMDHTSIPWAGVKIVNAVRQRNTESADGQFARSLEELALLSRIKADFLEAGISERVRVAVEGNSVELFGSVSLQEKERMENILKGIEEIQSVKRFPAVITPRRA